MRLSTSLLTAAAVLSTASASGIKGFNYGANFNNNQAKQQADFEYEFNAAKQLPNTNAQYTSARLYTMIQHGTTNTVISAIQAAINTKTTLLLGMWASAGQANFDNEIVALKAAITKYGQPFADLVVGISVGSEDLYRNTPTGIKNNAGQAAQPSELVKYIQQTRAAIKGTSLASKPIGHVDTWTVYPNATNAVVIDNLDFIGMDAYPYFQSTMANSIGNANKTFYDALAATKAASKGKPVWVTETGWPVIGDTLNQAVANAANAKIYWQDVACSLGAANVNFYWYMLQEAQYGNPNPDFGIKGPGDLMQIQPRYDLTCSAKVSTLPSYLLLSILSPLFILLLYNVALISSLASRLLPVKEQCCQCDCMPSTLPVVHPTIWPRKLVDWHARSNGFAKSLNSSVPTPTGTEIPSTSLSISISTTASEPTIIWPPTPIPLVTPDSPVTTSPVIMPDPFSSIAPEPLTLTGPFEFPHLVVPIDNANPDTVIGSQYVARLSPTYSSLFNFDVRPSYAGKTCSLVFHLPLLSGDWWQLIQYKSAGGIIVSQLNNIATDMTSASKVGNTRPIGSVSSLSPGGGYTINSAPCEAGKTVGYRIDAVGGLNLQYFQMVTPPTGLFMTASD